jgi:hypothetical protein
MVLREELEYYSITEPGLARTNPQTGRPCAELKDVKKRCGKALAERKTVFTGLQKNVTKERNTTEQHLIDMLYMR